MSQYSELIGSFIRTGDFALEGDYIFSDLEALEEYYSDSTAKATLHVGLLRVVLSDDEGELSLYWVTTNEDGDLEFSKLISGVDIDNLEAEITSLQESLTEATTSTDETVKAIAGTDEDDVVSYLQTLSYTSLTALAEALDKFLNETDSDDTTINTFAELQAFLDGYTDSDTLATVLDDLWTKIEGDPLPSEDLRTLRGLEDAIVALQTWSESRDNNLLTEIDQTQVGVGLSSDGSYSADQETYYLQDATSVMNALKTLDALVYKAISGISLSVDNDDVVSLEVTQGTDSWVISASLDLSSESGNELLKKTDGLYINVISTYEDGVLTLKVNDNIVAQHLLTSTFVGILSATYDTDTESIIIVFELASGSTLTITVPVAALIREWEVDNSGASDVVVLTKTLSTTDTDKLSADVRIASSKYNILTKVDNTLMVEGTTDNITHNDTTLSVVLDEVDSEIDELQSALSNLYWTEVE